MNMSSSNSGSRRITIQYRWINSQSFLLTLHYILHVSLYLPSIFNHEKNNSLFNLRSAAGSLQEKWFITENNFAVKDPGGWTSGDRVYLQFERAIGNGKL